ncbi:LOW QUALITY PROTEIN: hypothetical protein CVT26_013188 [Gymnopilus dilepis]|uniref:Uncharacterized protein n=1 Tax=Gymnopilus dilepis TaxID=231916 RepID=A0A409VWC8_9AGAR|nr:LOW QUALITY PROTEIN: hypothetical protein CVT26_013188 [Gymnopilus dilepis]
MACDGQRCYWEISRLATQGSVIVIRSSATLTFTRSALALAINHRTLLLIYSSMEHVHSCRYHHRLSLQFAVFCFCSDDRCFLWLVLELEYAVRCFSTRPSICARRCTKADDLRRVHANDDDSGGYMRLWFMVRFLMAYVACLEDRKGETGNRYFMW